MSSPCCSSAGGTAGSSGNACAMYDDLQRLCDAMEAFEARYPSQSFCSGLKLACNPVLLDSCGGVAPVAWPNLTLLWQISRACRQVASTRPVYDKQAAWIACPAPQSLDLVLPDVLLSVVVSMLPAGRDLDAVADVSRALRKAACSDRRADLRVPVLHVLPGHPSTVLMATGGQIGARLQHAFFRSRGRYLRELNATGLLWREMPDRRLGEVVRTWTALHTLVLPGLMSEHQERLILQLTAPVCFSQLRRLSLRCLNVDWTATTTRLPLLPCLETLVVRELGRGMDHRAARPAYHLPRLTSLTVDALGTACAARHTDRLVWACRATLVQVTLTRAHMTLQCMQEDSAHTKILASSARCFRRALRLLGYSQEVGVLRVPHGVHLSLDDGGIGLVAFVTWLREESAPTEASPSAHIFKVNRLSARGIAKQMAARIESERR